jgi:hypothetical protein
MCCRSSGDNILAPENYRKTANGNHELVLKCEQQCDVLSLLKSQKISKFSFCFGIFKGSALFSHFSYALLLPSFPVTHFFLSIIFCLPFVMLLPFFYNVHFITALYFLHIILFGTGKGNILDRG